MGEVGGFLKYGRVEPGYRDVMQRLKDYKAVELELQGEELKRQAARCMDCGIPFCHSSYGCPVSNIIPEFNDFLYRGHWKKALDILLSTNNFPEFTGRICPAPCEMACTLNINDNPVTIRQIELALIEMGFAKGYITPRPPLTRYPQKVAVIGSGPAGLAAADTLNKAGYYVTVYEREKNPGGILQYGIPDFKLEKWVVQRRVELMREEGVIFETEVMVGSDVSYKYLTKRFDAICLTGGAQIPRDLDIPGRELEGTYFAMDFLTRQNKINAREPVDMSDKLSATGKNVVVVGGGDTGSDCLGTSLRQGAKQVIQLEILPEPPEKRTEDMPWPTWPRILRRSSSHKEGGETRWSVTTKKMLGKNGKIEKLVCAEVDWKKGPDGFKMVERKGSQFEIAADLVLLAMGFVGPGINPLAEAWKLEKTPRGFIQRDEQHMTSRDGVFVAGDMFNGPSLVVRAINDGREAACAISGYLEGKRK